MKNRKRRKMTDRLENITVFISWCRNSLMYRLNNSWEEEEKHEEKSMDYQPFE